MIFPGATLFELKASHGLPLDFALDRITEAGKSVDWPGFIEAARRNGWWDFQTLRVLTDALQDSMWRPHERDAVLDEFRRYVVAHPHQEVAPA